MLNIKKVHVPYPNQKVRDYVEAQSSFFSGEDFKFNRFIAICCFCEKHFLSKILIALDMKQEEFENYKTLCLE